MTYRLCIIGESRSGKTAVAEMLESLWGLGYYGTSDVLMHMLLQDLRSGSPGVFNSSFFC